MSPILLIGYTHQYWYHNWSANTNIDYEILNLDWNKGIKYQPICIQISYWILKYPKLCRIIGIDISHITNILAKFIADTTHMTLLISIIINHLPDTNTITKILNHFWNTVDHISIKICWPCILRPLGTTSIHVADLKRWNLDKGFVVVMGTLKVED